MSKRIVASLLLTALAWSSQAAEMDIQISAPVIDKTLPSGSGMSWHRGQFFVVGDDAPDLFVLDRNFAIVDRFLLKAYPVQADGRIPKDLKPDYEAMASVAWNGSVWNLILGSGSLPGVRETGFLVSTDGKFVSHAQDMADLYRDLATRAGFNAGQFVNIEALAIADDHAYLFNRGNAGRNLLFKLGLGDLMAYMSGATRKIRNIEMHEAQLPRWKGVEAGFSGADYWPEIRCLVYSASVERSANAVDDGSVLGSYLGLIPLSMLKDNARLDLSQSAQLISRNNVPVATKVESVVLTRTERHRATGALVSDNDDGSSEFFDLVLTLRPATRP